MAFIPFKFIYFYFSLILFIHLVVFLQSTCSEKDSSQQTRITTEKLIDGLLPSSGFDEESCLSRFQSYLCRKASPHKPSSYLISKLRNYEKLHKSCGPQTRSYNKTITELLKSGTNGTASNSKYIVWTPGNGLGNRMISIVATFLHAVLTDLVLLVQFNTDMVGLLCESFPSSSWILPKDFPFINNQRYMETYESMLHKDKENNSRLISPVVVHL
ncbi:hypothetical protein L6164_000098 [Bauhinia variegata]|uniref:Uncharacterized protein n=1 Tax=Bauhinia variegata TaxID=167791 RepID=A0ACB9QB21_BAUVA|nr:hypothetical protein L6164_000098 [Bauhinia variegata]